MIQGYKRFMPPPLAKPATSATTPKPTCIEVALVAGVAANQVEKTVTYPLPDDPEERASIMEFDGGLSRTDAECRAGITPLLSNQ